MIIKLCKRWRQKKNELLIPLLILFTSCSTLDKGVEFAVEGQKAITKETTRTEVRKEVAPLVERFKALSYRMDLLTKEMARMSDNFGETTNAFGDLSTEINKFVLAKMKKFEAVKKEIRAILAEMKKLKKRIEELEKRSVV